MVGGRPKSLAASFSILVTSPSIIELYFLDSAVGLSANCLVSFSISFF
jgi:hypothetical protein